MSCAGASEVAADDGGLLYDGLAAEYDVLRRADGRFARYLVASVLLNGSIPVKGDARSRAMYRLNVGALVVLDDRSIHGLASSALADYDASLTLETEMKDLGGAVVRRMAGEW